MKRGFGTAFITAFVALAIFVSWDSRHEEVFTIQQNSVRAIIDLTGVEWEEALAAGKIRIDAPGEDAVTLVRVNSPNPVGLIRRLESNGSIYVIAPGGLLVGSGENESEPISFPPVEMDTIEQGNSYALAVEREGRIRAVTVSTRPNRVE